MQRRHLLSTSAALAAAAALPACSTAPSGVSLAVPAGGLQPVPALPAGATVAVLAPASPAPGQADAAAAWLAERGFAPRLLPSALQGTEHQEDRDYPGGSDGMRVQDLHTAFADPQVRAIVCLRGGYGSARLLADIDFDLVRRHPKPFIGYSDITALHLALAREAGWISFHGPMLASDLLRSPPAVTEQALWALVQGRQARGAWLPHPSTPALRVLRPGAAQGRLAGGNLALISSLMGTRWEIDTQGAILFIEDVDEPPYKIDRMLVQLQLAGKLKGVRGVLIGDFSGVSAAGSTPERQARDADRLLQVWRDRLLPLGVPVLSGWLSGHCSPNLTLPLGALVTLDAGTRPGVRLDQAVTA